MSEKKHRPQLIARESAIKILYQMKMQDETFEKIMNGFIEKREYDVSLLERRLASYSLFSIKPFIIFSNVSSCIFIWYKIFIADSRAMSCGLYFFSDIKLINEIHYF